MALVEFTGRRTNRKRRMSATISSTRYLSISGDVIEALGSPAFAVLLFDREARVVGIKAAPEPTPNHAFPVRANSAGFIIEARRFCEAYDIPARIYDLPVTIEDGIAVFELPAETE